MEPSVHVDATLSSIFDYYDLIGITEQLPKFLSGVLQLMEVECPITPAEVLGMVFANRSLGEPITITEEDKAYLESINAIDLILWEEARKRAELLAF
jgi:hypothetical protein